MNTTYDNLTKDLCQLYCKTQNKKIESLFLRLAQAPAQTFLSWITTANLSSLGLQSSDAINGLHLLAKMKASNPSTTYSNLSVFVMNNPSEIPHYGSLRAIGEVAGDPRVSQELSNFQDVWSVTAMMDIKTDSGASSSSMVDKTVLVSDLIRIIDAFHAKQHQPNLNSGEEDVVNYKKKKTAA